MYPSQKHISHSPEYIICYSIKIITNTFFKLKLNQPSFQNTMASQQTSIIKGKLENSHLCEDHNNQWAKEKIKIKIKNYLETNENRKTICHNYGMQKML